MTAEASICDQYCKIALAAVISEMKEELGKQTREVVSNAAKNRLGAEMVKLLKNGNGNRMGGDFESMCELIKSCGGPTVTCEAAADEMVVEIHECHLIDAVEMEPYICDITHGWIEAVVSELLGDNFIVERVHTIAEGHETCMFRCQKNYQSIPSVEAALKRIENLQDRISDECTMIMEFQNANDFNKFSMEVQKMKNATIRNVNIFPDKYVLEISVHRKDVTMII